MHADWFGTPVCRRPALEAMTGSNDHWTMPGPDGLLRCPWALSGEQRGRNRFAMIATSTASGSEPLPALLGRLGRAQSTGRFVTWTRYCSVSIRRPAAATADRRGAS